MEEQKPPFTPKGDEPEWQMIYDHLITLDVGDKVTYGTLSALLERPFGDNRAPYYAAVRRLQQSRKKTLKNIPGVGYIVVEPKEHLDLAHNHVRRSHRQLRMAGERLEVDRSQLDPTTRQKFEALSLHLKRTRTVVMGLNRRTVDNEEAMAEIRKQTQATRRQVSEDVASLSDKFDQLQDALRRHGIPMNPQIGETTF